MVCLWFVAVAVLVAAVVVTLTAGSADANDSAVLPPLLQ